MSQLTAQGVKDLGTTSPRPRLTREMVNQCSHRRLRSCCRVNGRSCGHIECPDCDLFIDVGAELNGRWMW